MAPPTLFFQFRLANSCLHRHTRSPSCGFQTACSRLKSRRYFPLLDCQQIKAREFGLASHSSYNPLHLYPHKKWPSCAIRTFGNASQQQYISIKKRKAHLRKLSHRSPKSTSTSTLTRNQQANQTARAQDSWLERERRKSKKSLIWGFIIFFCIVLLVTGGVIVWWLSKHHWLQSIEP